MTEDSIVTPSQAPIGTTGPGLPQLRQIVLLTGDLAGALAEARAAFRVPPGTRDEPGMAAIGFRHEVVGFDRTYLEICEPLDPQSPPGRRITRDGDSGFMVVVQVDDAAAMLRRAADCGLSPLMSKDFYGSPISQWHPREFGTIAEFDQMIPPQSWHLAPGVYDSRSTAVVADIAQVRLAVPEPAEVAARWATVTGGTLLADGTTVGLGAGTVAFVPRVEGAPAFAVDCLAAEPGLVGIVVRLCGVDFTLI
jgi:hypothetical protein